jgi:hypothetical protein
MNNIQIARVVALSARATMLNTEISFEQASEIISQLAANNWKRTA